MARYRRIKRRSSRSKKFMLLFIGISLLLVSGGYSILGSDVGLLGTLFVNKYKNMAVIQSFSSGDKTKFRSDTYRTKIETITLSESINPPEEYIESWNLGINGKSNVMGYITKRSDADIYDLYIQGDGNLYANPDSTYLFGGFEGLQEIIGLDKLNTSEVTNMSYMFAVSTSSFSGKSKLTSLDLSKFDTSKVTNMSSMFRYCNGLTSLDVRGFDTSNVTSMGSMFNSCTGLTSLDVSRFYTSKVIDMGSMFNSCTGLTSLDVSGFDTSQVTSMGSMFNSCTGLTSLDVSGFDTSKVTYISYMFSGCSSLTSLNVSGFNTSKVTSMGYMFYNCSSLTSLNLSNFNTSKVTSMRWMFQNCRGLTSLDVSGFDTSKVTDMFGMFYSCSKLISLDVSGFDTSQVTSMGSMFNSCTGLTSLDVSGFDTSKVTYISYMFSGCSSLTSLNVSGFNTSKVTSMGYMFYNCSSLTSLNVSGFDTSKVTNMSYMFNSCKGLTSLDVSGFDTSQVTNMSYMFSNCNGLTCFDLSNFDTSKVTDMSEMFGWCGNLTTIYAGPKWNVASVTNSTNMFLSCTKLVGAVAFDSTKTDASMANYETGYLTFRGNVYTVNMYDSNDTQNSQVFINKPISEKMVQYNTPSEALANFENRPFYLKHVIEGSIVKESYVEFVVSEELSTANAGMRAGIYALKGVDTTAYESNKEALKTAFGESHCADYSSHFVCSVSSLVARTTNDGVVSVGNDSRSCSVFGEGYSSCG